MKFLIVDDDESCRNLPQFFLTELGHSAETCEDPTDALTRLENESFDVLLIDQLMPEMTGFEMIRALRKKGIGIPVYMISCLYESDILKTAKRCGVEVQGVINKLDFETGLKRTFA